VLNSIKKNRDFVEVYQNGKSYANKYLIMYVLENNSDENRFGITVSKKVYLLMSRINILDYYRGRGDHKMHHR